MMMFYETVLTGAKEEIISYARQYRVPVDQLDEKLAESISASGSLPSRPAPPSVCGA